MISLLASVSALARIFDLEYDQGTSDELDRAVQELARQQSVTFPEGKSRGVRRSGMNRLGRADGASLNSDSGVTVLAVKVRGQRIRVLVGDAGVMASGMVSRWPVLVSLPVVACDCDEHGLLRDAAVERLFAHATAAYFDRCATVDESTLEVQGKRHPAWQRCSRWWGFTMAAMLRPRSTDGVAATTWCSLSPWRRGADADAGRVRRARACRHVLSLMTGRSPWLTAT